MNNSQLIKAVTVASLLGIGGFAHGFVGTIAVGLGQMDEEVGEIETAFAADAKLETEDMTANTRIHYKPGMVRDEVNVGGEQMVTIRRFDTNKVWMLMGQGMYMEVDAEQGSNQAPEYTLVSREVIGPETVNGIETTKYKSVYESKDGKFGGFTWFTDDNIAVKGFLISETKGEKQRVKFEFTNLERGAQADSLFEIPAGYTKFDMSGMAGMQGMGQMGGTAPGGVYGGSAPASGTAPADQAPGGDTQGQPGAADGGFAGEVADEAQTTAEETVKDETKRGVRDSVRKGIGKLFGR